MTSFSRLLRGVGGILLRNEKLWMLALALLDMLMSLADLFALLVLLFLINAYTRSSSHPIWPAVQQQLQSNNPVLVTGIFLLLFCIKNLAGAWLAAKQSHFVYQVASRASEEKLREFLNGSYTDFVFTDSSVQQRRINRAPIEFAHYVLANMQQIIAQVILVALTFCGVMLYRPRLFVLLIVFLLPPFIALAWFVKSRLNRLRGHIKTQSEQALQYLHEALAGYVEGNIYNRAQFFTRRYATRQQALNNSLGAQHALQGLSSRMIELFAVLGFFILLLINQYFVGQGGISITILGVFVASAYKIIPGLVKIINAAGQIKTYSFTLNELQRPMQQERQTAATSAINSIEFNSVSYRHAEKAVFSNLSFSLQPGDIAGVTGASGKGKTTMLNILLGFLEQQSGHVCINGHVCNAADRKTYWERVGYVKQQDFFINDTIINNIILGDEHANSCQLDRAVTIAGLDSIFTMQDGGLEKTLSENGRNISGGQRQRITLARALYRNFDVLMLDEPFSELDETATTEILERLTAAFSNKIVLFITHNPNSLQWCNKIIGLYAE